MTTLTLEHLPMPTADQIRTLLRVNRYFYAYVRDMLMGGAPFTNFCDIPIEVDGEPVPALDKEPSPGSRMATLLRELGYTVSFREEDDPVVKKHYLYMRVEW